MNLLHGHNVSGGPLPQHCSTSWQAGYEAACADVEKWLVSRLEGRDRPGVCLTVNLYGFRSAFGVKP